MASPKKVKALVESINRYGEGVALFGFKPLGRVPRFKPGQFMHLTLEEYDPAGQWPESRVFSIASSPVRKDSLKALISVKGKYTGRIFNELKVWSSIWLKLPYGDFIIKDRGRKIILIAGGTGIAPFVSFLGNCLDTRQTVPVKLYYGIRDDALLIYNDLLNECENRIPGFSKEIYTEQVNTVYQLGRLSIQKIIHDNGIHADYYLSGPLDMIKSFRSELAHAGVEPDGIIIDEW